ncbi:hypothetical protein [Desulfopila sp. IMCC35008]|uniref:hypothetical protein n=1 Tax=Desulfopila sp. IMCC35008 TaxID=2653858 RepID=UPI001F111ABC|nr:hypothetical protein [Desulfopila sp. IMCC35008]
MYQYLSNNPINLFDVLGLFADKEGMDDTRSPGSLEDAHGNGDTTIQWGRVGKGVVETIGGILGIVGAAYSEVQSMGAASIVVGSLVGFSIPALSHGISEITAGFMGIEEEFPAATAPTVATLAITGNPSRAKSNDLIVSSLMLGQSIGTWTVKFPGVLEITTGATEGAGVILQSTEINQGCQEDSK